MQLIPSLFALVCLASPLMAQTIVGSKHDFSGRSWNTQGAICRVCHIPHNGPPANAGVGLLWNATLSTATYTLYKSDSLQGSPEQPRASSKLCLGCHDGTVAINMGWGGDEWVTGSAKVGTDLQDSHPISIKWQHQTLTSMSSSFCYNCHFNPPRATPFFDGYVECASCHEPHNDAPLNPGGAFMLRLTNTGSRLCLNCHEK